MQQTKVNPGWLIKISIFMVATTAFGMWGLFDALVIYPARGNEHAEFMSVQYLRSLRDAALPWSEAPVADPAQERQRLRAQRAQLRHELESANATGQIDLARRREANLARLEWLEALHRIGALKPERTAFDSPRDRFNELQEVWQGKDPPKPLAAYDIPLQWAIFVIFTAIGVWLAILIAMVASRRYRWDPESLRLVLPDGREATPETIEEIDKRKWDKFIVYLKLKGEEREIKLDLLRYKPLEDWVLALEKRVHGDESAPDAETSGDADAHEASEAST